MKERQILFNTKMVNAILSGHKRQTRRLMSPQPEPKPGDLIKHWWPCDAVQNMVDAEDQLRADDPEWKGLAASCCPIAQIGDLLYVRETVEKDLSSGNAVVRYRADGQSSQHEWSYNRDYAPSIHMKKEHARIWLKVTGIRAERVQNITESDAKYEGVAPAFLNPLTGNVCTTPEYRYGFAKIWKETGGEWDSNPWVWVIDFDVL